MIVRAVAGTEQAGMRLDDGVRQLFPHLSKSQIRRIIDWGGCTIGTEKARVASRKLREGDEITLGIMEKENCRDLAYDTGDMIHEDENCLAVNKGAGINCQRTPYQLSPILILTLTAKYSVWKAAAAVGEFEERLSIVS